MNKRIAIPVIAVLVIVLIVGGYFLWQQTSKLTEAESEISALEGNVSTLEGNVATLETKLADSEAEVSTLEADLSAAQSRISSLQSDLTTAESERDSLKQEADSLGLRVSSLSEEVAMLNEEVGSLSEEIILLAGSLELYRDTYGEMYSGVQPPYLLSLGRDVRLINNEEATNPTWAELKDFLHSDRTDGNPYIEGQYMCGSFAEDVHNNAEEVGIRAALVGISFEDPTIPSHALNAFKTTDGGLFFIDCTGLEPSEEGPYHLDTRVVVKLGKELIARLLFADAWRIIPGSGRIVKTIEIYW